MIVQLGGLVETGTVALDLRIARMDCPTQEGLLRQALGRKAVFRLLAIPGSATLWMAVFADMGASLLVVFNGLRLLYKAN